MKSSFLFLATFLFCQILNAQGHSQAETCPQGQEPTDTTAPTLSLAPNPANDEVLISWSLPATADITLSVADIQGSISITLPLGEHTPGQYSKAFGTAALSNGIYVTTLRVGKDVLMQRLVVAH